MPTKLTENPFYAFLNHSPASMRPRQVYILEHKTVFNSATTADAMVRLQIRQYSVFWRLLSHLRSLNAIWSNGPLRIVMTVVRIFIANS